jgi:hypothetical protein
LPLSQVISTNAEARSAAAYVSAALHDFLGKTLSLNVNNFVKPVQTVNGVDEIANVVSQPWDSKVIKNIRRKSDDGTSWLSLIVVNSLEEVESIKLQTFDSNQPQYVYVEQNALKILPVPTAVYDLQIYYTAAIPRITVDDLTDITTLDAEGDYILSLYVEAYYREKQGDPVSAAKFGKAENLAETYRQKNNRLAKRIGKSGRINMWFPAGDFVV